MTPDNFDTVASVTLIGAGPLGCSFAADLASRGVSVMIYCQPDHPGYLGMIEKNDGWLKASGNVNGTFKVHTTTDMDVALQHSPFIVSTVPSFGHENVMRTLRPFDLRNHILVVTVGNFFYLSARQTTNAKAVAETDISPYATRVEDDVVLVKGTKHRLAIWMAPSSSQVERQDQIIKRQIDTIFTPHLDWCQSLLQVGLNNINPICHSPAILMNTGWIESTCGDFHFYRQGMSPSVSKVTERIDQERLIIGRAYGIELMDITQYMNENYVHTKKFNNYREFAEGTKIHNKTKGAPKNMNHRYLLEDVGHCMVLWYELGLKSGLTSPGLKALIDLASIVSGFDYLSRRGLKAAGLAEASKEQIAAALGESPPVEVSRARAPLSDAHANSLETRIPMQQQKAEVAA